jgi:polyhydroxybutyrate depolymerase
VVFNFHGYGSNANQQIQYGDFRPLADRDGFLVVAPNHQGASFTLALGILDSLEANFCVDAKRVFSTGMSLGGAMTVQLACNASDRFAAFGAVAVVYYAPPCDKARSVPIAAFMGTADPIVPFEGGKVRCCGSPNIPAAPASMTNWASHDKCAAQPEEHRVSPAVLLRQWTGCAPAGDVRFYIVEGGGHTWPGAAVRPTGLLGPTTTEINASEILWAFFQAHPLPG